MGTMQSGVTSPSFVTSPSNEVSDSIIVDNSISLNSSGKLSFSKLEAALSKIHSQNQIIKPPVTVANTQQTKTYAEALQLNADGNGQNTTATFQQSQSQSQSIVVAPKEVLPLSRKISRFEISVVKESGNSQTNQQQAAAPKMSPGLSPAKSVKDAKSSTTTLVTMTDGSTSTSMLNKTNSAASQTVLSESDASVAIGGDGNDDIISTHSDGSNMHITNINNVDPETMKYWTNLKERKTSSDSFCSTNSDIEEFQRQQQQLIYQQHIMQTQQQQMHQQQQQLQQQQQQQIQQLQQQQIPIQQQQQMNQQQHVQQQTSAIIHQQQLFPQQPQLQFDPLMTSVRNLVRKIVFFLFPVINKSNIKLHKIKETKHNLDAARKTLVNINMELKCRQQLLLLLKRQQLEEEELILRHYRELEKFNKSIEIRKCFKRGNFC